MQPKDMSTAMIVRPTLSLALFCSSRNRIEELGDSEAIRSMKRRRRGFGENGRSVVVSTTDLIVERFPSNDRQSGDRNFGKRWKYGHRFSGKLEREITFGVCSS
ncbi:hypothetical protein K0M31_018239 [Melipona bicolor]|uniref:Uncharacterized protein n=1 Tax=Melipona bicolor TaxID=60889 RepID=A0AA40FCT4_9HYME|nr:hypothetical protein K0M31_018239 [Melipona bicolor]